MNSHITETGDDIQKMCLNCDIDKKLCNERNIEKLKSNSKIRRLVKIALNILSVIYFVIITCIVFIFKDNIKVIIIIVPILLLTFLLLSVILTIFAKSLYDYELWF